MKRMNFEETWVSFGRTKWARRAARSMTALCLISSLTACVSSVEDGEGMAIEVEREDVFGVGWEDYLSQAIRGEDGGYIAEGDLLFASESALRKHYDQMVAEHSEKLVVIRRLSDGFEPVLVGPEQLALTYCVSNSFANKSAVVSDMASATKSWEEVARLRFVYTPGQDASCSDTNSNVVFAVMPTTVSNLLGCAGNKELWTGVLSNWGCRTAVGAPYIKGVVLLNYGIGLPVGQTRVGVVRHELGHLLGFRHEHPWDSPAVCGEQQTYTGSDLTGRQLTPYDISSVMHYQDCDGLSGTDYVLSRLDGVGARSIYGMPAAWHVPHMNALL